jgi:hypothetical protein
MSIALAFFVFTANHLSIFSVKIVHAFDASVLDTCGLASSTSGSFTKSGGTCQINTNQVSGLGAGQDLILSNGAVLTIKTGAELILAPGAKIILDSAGAKGSIVMETGGDPSKGIRHGYLALPDADADGFINGSATTFTKVLTDTVSSTPFSSGYTEKSSLKPAVQADCNDSSYSLTNVCCTNGYKDYDKDGDGTGAYGCHAPDIAYNVSANNYDCDDSNATIKNGWSTTSFCGVGTCGGSGTDSCTNGVRNNTCVTSSKLCCNAGVGTYKTAQTPISTCLKCNGTQADPVNQTSSEDLNNVCATGALGSGTSCRDVNCSGAGDYCGSLADTAICNYGSYSAYSGASGDCTLTSSRPIYKCSAGTCSGTSSGTDFNTPQYIALGNIWNGSASVAATCALNKGYGAGMYCSGSAYNSTIQQSAYGCNAAGGADTTTPKATCNQSTCTVRMENGVSCSSGVCASTSNCSDTVDNDSDGFKDAADPQCGAGGCGQCTPNSTCCDALGCYLSSSTLCLTDAWSGFTGANGACTMGRSQTYHNCNGSGTCSAAVAGTNFDTQYAPSEGKIVSSNAWITATAGNNRGIVAPYSCASNTTINGSFVGCNTAGGTGTVVQGTTATGVTCTGAENNMCIAGNSACVNACIAPYNPADNNGNGFNDGQDSACGGAGQCTSGVCCNTSNGSFITLASNTTCSACTPNTGASGACQITGTGYKCSGTSASCVTTAPYATSCTGNASTVGNIWNGSSWVAASCSIYSSLSSPYGCSSNTITASAYGCNTSGGADLTTIKATCNSTTCSGGTPKCVSGSCRQCTVTADCSSSDGYWCSGNQAYYRTNSCSSNNCVPSDSTTTYCNAGNSMICSSGSCLSCSAGYYISGGSCVAAGGNSYYSPGGISTAPTMVSAGYYSTGGTSTTRTGQTQCEPGYYCSGGVRYACAAGYYGSSYGNTTSTCNGSCLSGYYCPAGSTSNTQNSCPNGTSSSCNSGSLAECLACPAGTYFTNNWSAAPYCCTSLACSDGSHQCLTCPKGSYCTGGSNISSCPAGTYNPNEGSTSASACSVCAAGYFCDGSEDYYDFIYTGVSSCYDGANVY